MGMNVMFIWIVLSERCKASPPSALSAREDAVEEALPASVRPPLDAVCSGRNSSCELLTRISRSVVCVLWQRMPGKFS